MFNPADVVPEYIRQRYPSVQAFQRALYTGEVIRDCYGRFHFREEFQPQFGYCNNPYCFMAKPVEELTREIPDDILDFSFFNIENIRGCYKIDTDGYIIRLVNAEDIARGAGLTKVENHTRTSARTAEQLEYSYDSIQWSRFNEYAQDSLKYINLDREMKYFTFPIGKDSYIPLALATMIIQHCTSTTARQFQGILNERIMNNIDREIDNRNSKMLETLQGKINSRDRQLEQQKNLMDQTAEYYEEFNSTKHCFRSTEIAKQFGLSAQTFHQLLHHIGIIFPVNNSWQVYDSYAHFGCLVEKNENGQVGTFWTNNGRMIVIIKLQQYGLVIGQDNTAVVDRILNQ